MVLDNGSENVLQMKWLAEVFGVYIAVIINLLTGYGGLSVITFSSGKNG